MIIETERLVLRELAESDFDALYAVLADSDIMEHYPYTFDEARVRGWIDRNIERYRTDGFGLWAVVLKESGEMIGDCGITMQSIKGEMLPEIGYHIRADKQRKGYATEAAAACMDYAFTHYDFPQVYSYMKYTNVASAAVAVKNGMKFIEEYPDPDNSVTKVYAISREEWAAMNKSKNIEGVKSMKSICGANCKECTMKQKCSGCEESGGCPFGSQCFIAKNILSGGEEKYRELKQTLINEFNSLNVAGMAEITDLFALNGRFVNLEYTLPSGQQAKFLEDSAIYLGNQVECSIEGKENRCFGLVADEDFLLVCEYGEGGADPEIVIYKRR